MRRTLALWLLLFGVCAATLALDAFGDSDYGGDEPHYLLAAESLLEDGNVDVQDEYAERAFGEFYPYDLDRHGQETDGRLHEPHGVGFPLFVLPAYAVGGAQGVELFLAAVAAFAGSALLALRLYDRPGWRAAFGCFALLGALPWLGTKFVLPGVVIGLFAARTLWRSRRRTLAVGAVELSLFSVAVMVGVNEGLYGGAPPPSPPRRGGAAPRAPL